MHVFIPGAPPLNLEKYSLPALSWALPAPPHLKRGLDMEPLSPPSLPLKPSYSQIVQTKIPLHDPEKQACDPGKVTHDSSCGPLPVSTPCDQSHDQMRPCDPTRFGHATHLLIGTWKTVGTNQRSMGSKRSQGIPHSLFPMDTGTSNTLIGLRA